MKIVVATDRSETAQRAVSWAADAAARFEGELVLIQIVSEAVEGGDALLRADADAIPGARAVLQVDPDVAAAIVRTAEAERADLLVVGNAGMAGRKQFLLDNIPNRISHSARRSAAARWPPSPVAPRPARRHRG